VTERAGRGRSLLHTSLLLLALALVVRLAVFAVATGVGPDDSVGDVTFHAQLVADPVGFLRAPPPEISQYAPYLGLLEWVTAKPWLVVGASDLTALRLGSITWDLLGMALLLFAAARRFPRRLVLVGVMWAVAPLVWPASAYSAQDETIAAAMVAGAVALLFTGRRAASVAVCALALFATKILVAPILLALLLTTPRGSRTRSLGVAVGTIAIAITITSILSGTDGLTRQGSYSTDVLGFSVSVWSTVVLHRYLAPDTAIRASIVVAGLALLACVVVWWRQPNDGLLETSRLAAALSMTAFALLAVSNPEYLCIAAPVAIVGCIGLERLLQSWLLAGAAAVAWAVNVAYYVLRKAYDPTGSLLGITGFDEPVSRRVRIFDVTHQVLLATFLVASIVVVRNYLLGDRSHPPEVDASDPSRRAISGS
jgi:hypothetical protein